LKYVYVLVSNENDIFLEQLLLSITSLRNKNTDATVIVLIDDITVDSLTGKRSEIYKLSSEIKILTPPKELNNVKRSRWLKTSMRQNIDGDFLYIDCDTVIADDLSDIAYLNINLGSILDQHTLIENHPLKKRFKALDKELRFNSSLITNKHFNGGVLFCKDTPISHEFFNEWHKLWLLSVSKDIAVDQPSLNQANINLNNAITELGGIWNCQIEFNGLQYLSKSKIIHYFSSNRNEKPYLLANSEVFKKIKEAGYVPDEIKAYLEDTRSLFCPQLRLISDKRMLAIIDSSLFDYLLTRTFDTHNNSQVINALSSFIAGIREIKGNIHKRN
jgi:lipopolysaccharide biosynthesis glycosyltransferase